MSNEPYRPRILIVDDSLTTVELLDGILGTEYRVSFATNGAEGLLLCYRLSPDLILLDVMMPGTDGHEVCRRLKRDPATWDIPVIFLSSLDSAGDEEYGFSLGAEDFIHKPVSAPVVKARVRNHLLLANTKHQLRRHNEHLEHLVEERTREVAYRDQQLIAAQTATITAFCALAEARDNETGNHIRRTQNYVRALADTLRKHPRFAGVLNNEMIDLMFKSAPLHDVGKVAVPDSVLHKPGRLTPDERIIMMEHCAAGRDAIAAAARELGQGGGEFLGMAAEIAYSHHERWDGKGYPCGLAQDAIPISARLMAVADVYDALISRRIYKAPYSHQESVAIMAAERGAQFDPDVLDAMLAIADEFERIARRYSDSAAT